MEQMTDNRLNVDANREYNTLTLVWYCRFGFDGFGPTGQCRISPNFFFANEGSLEHSPFIQLLSDFAFEEVPTDNQEIVRIHAQKIESSSRVWFFCWDFEHVETESAAPFVDHDVSLNYVNLTE